MSNTITSVKKVYVLSPGRTARYRQLNGHDSLVLPVFGSESFLHRVIIKWAVRRYSTYLQLEKHVIFTSKKVQLRQVEGSDNKGDG